MKPEIDMPGVCPGGREGGRHQALTVMCGGQREEVGCTKPAVLPVLSQATLGAIAGAWGSVVRPKCVVLGLTCVRRQGRCKG